MSEELLAQVRVIADGATNGAALSTQVWTLEAARTFSIYALVFGFAVFVVMAILLGLGHHPREVLRIGALPLVIIGAIFLIIVGYSLEQITPVLSLLSAIAGYLLGNQESWQPKQRS